MFRNRVNKDELKKVLPETLLKNQIIESANKSGIVCPNCGNGNGDDGTGIIPSIYNGTPSYFCHKCKTHFDNLDLIALHSGLDAKKQFPQVLAEGATLLGSSAYFGNFNPYRKSTASSKKTQQEKTEQPPVDHSQLLQVAKNNLINLPSNDWRGLMPKTLIHFGCGFAVNWKHPDIKNAPSSDRLIIPTSNFHYLARAIDNSVPKEFAKQHVGHKEIFNPDALQNGATVFVVEGEVDCMSIWQATEGEIPCVAVSGCSNYTLLLKWLEKNPDCNCRFIVLFDNDSKSDAGQKAAKKFVQELHKLGFPAVNFLLSDKQDFDANDWLSQNPAEPTKLRDRLFDIYIQGEDELDQIEDKIKKDAEFNKQIADWEQLNGKIKPVTLESVITARDNLLALTTETFKPSDLNSSAFRRQLGLCEFYNFSADALNNFWGVFTEVKEGVTTKKLKKESLSNDEKIVGNFSREVVRKIIRDSVKLLKAEHSEFQKEVHRQERQHQRLERQQKIEQAQSAYYEELLRLKQMSPSPERDQEMREIIRELCEWQCDRYGVPQYIKATTANYNLIFDFDPVIENLFARNDFVGATVFTKEPFWTTEKATARLGEPFQKDDIDELSVYLATEYKEINGFHKLREQITKLANKNTFHPVKNYFDNLPQWDGIPRADKLFVDFLRVNDSSYIREVTLNFFIGAIARVYHPGCEYQYSPVLMGSQGIGKGKIIKMLVDSILDSGYVELTTKLHDSHAMDILRLAWFVELPENSATEGVSNAAIKSFISKRGDSNRFAYDKDAKTVKRHNVFFITTNEKFPLKDKSGNRRFLPIQSNLTENEFVEGLNDEYIAQFWAEVWFKYNEMFKDGFDEKKLLLSKETLLTATKLAKDCTEDDGLTGEILAFLDSPIPHKAIWQLLSRTERQQFFQNGSSITLDPQNLRGRQFARRRPEEMQALEAVLRLADFDDILSVQQNPNGTITFYGAAQRDSICPSEVLLECFYSADKRVSIKAIAEILATELPKNSWEKGRKKSTVYGDQPNTYCRDVVNEEIVIEPPLPPEPADSFDDTEFFEVSATPPSANENTDTATDTAVCEFENNVVTITSSAEYEAFLTNEDTPHNREDC